MLNRKFFYENKLLWLGAIGAMAITGFIGAHTIVSANAQASVMTTNAVVAVSVEKVTPKKIRIWSNFSGRTQAVDFAEIRPEVSGRITDVRFKDGQTVRAGEVLFVIDPRPYEAAVTKAEANLASTETNTEFAKVELDRAASMIKTQAIPQQLYDQRANAYRVSKAAALGADAELKLAKINQDRAYVKAPIAGRVSRAEITLGNVVQAGSNAPVLTSIVSREGIYADFDVDEQTYMEIIRSHANTHEEERRIPVELVVQGDESHPYEGTIYSFDNRIDTGSGTIRARARFNNKDGHLIPGMFVSIRMANGGDNSTITVPYSAVGNDQSKKFVYVVSADSKVAYRSVTLGRRVGDQQIILSGLQDGENVIVDGAQNVKSGSTVQVKNLRTEHLSAQKMAAN